MSQDRRVSIVIPVHNAPEYVSICLASLIEHTDPSSFELIIVDDASGPETQTLLKEFADHATIIRNDQNLGFAKTCNIGAKTATGEYLLFLNSDIEVSENWLPNFLSSFDRDPRIACAGCKLVFPDGTIQHAGVCTYAEPSSGTPLAASHVCTGAPGDLPEANSFLALDAVTGAAMLFRASTFFEVGMFDEEYFNGSEDIDVCLKLREKGYVVAYNPEVCLVHYESKSGPARWLKALNNARRLAARWTPTYCPNFYSEELEGALPYPKELWRSDEAKQHLECQVSTVVVVDNDLPSLPLFIEGLRAHLGLFNEAIIIDNASEDGSAGFLAECIDTDVRVKIILNTEKKSLGACINQATALCNGKYVALVSPDRALCSGWWYRLIQQLVSNNLGAVGAVSDSEVQAFNFRHYLPETWKGTYTAKDVDEHLWETNRRKYVPAQWTGEGCLLLEWTTLTDIDGLTEDLPWDSANLDLSLRLKSFDYKMGIAADTFVPRIPGQYESNWHNDFRAERFCVNQTQLEFLLTERYGGAMPNPIDLWGHAPEGFERYETAA